jgi:amidophosphoribosyltransferase
MTSDKIKEACGVFGIYSKTPYDIVYDVQLGLFALQHRGEESAGLAYATADGVSCYKNMGMVPQVMSDNILKSFPKSNIAIGHVRYSTTGSSNIVNSQPLLISGRSGEIALGHNGNIFNSGEVRERLTDKKILLQTTIDSEIIAALINLYYDGDIVKAISFAAKDLKGSYAFTMMDKNRLIAVRDQSGIRPLVMGEKPDGTVVIASETPALDVVGAAFTRDIRPGEILIVDITGIHLYNIDGERPKGLCSFEFVYFARTDSVIDGLAVYNARRKAGELLAKNHSVEADIVSSVPDTAAVAAQAYADYSGIPFTEVLSKNRYIGRTFIQPQQSERENMVKIKLAAIKHNVRGKRIILIDDSIVRGTTCKNIISLLYEAGAREVHMRITSPPVKFACYFGIDIQNEGELIGAKNTQEMIAAILGCDSVEYLGIEELREMCGGANLDICTGCFSGKYPIEVGINKIDKLRME